MKSVASDNRKVLRGQALVPVIFIMMILTMLAVAFATTAHVEVRAATNFANRMASFYAARGALNYAMSALAQTSNNGGTYGVIPADETSDANGWRQIGDAWVEINAVDTGSCINLNTVPLAMLQQFPVFQQNADIPPAIIDWRTAGEQQSANGAKSSYYQSLPTPYNCKDAPFDTVDELLLVKEMTPDILYGTIAGTQSTTLVNGTLATSTTLNQGSTATSRGAAMSRQSGMSSQSGQSSNTNFSDIFANSTVPMAELLTTNSQELNIAADGTARVNINTATAQALQQIGLTSAQANAIVTYRTNATQGAGGTGTTGTGNTAGGTGSTSTGKRSIGGLRTRQAKPPVSTPTTTTTALAAAAASGATGGTGGTGGAAATTAFTNIAGLLCVPGITPTVMQTIADHVTTDTGTTRNNVVNINTAPAEVLATVPGMDRTVLNAIVQYQQSGQAFQTLGDFFTLSGISTQEFQAVVGGLTAKSSLYEIHIKVLLPGQNMYAVSALVQLTANGPNVLQWREVQRVPGWAAWIAPPNLPTPPTSNGTTSPSTNGTSGAQ